MIALKDISVPTATAVVTVSFHGDGDVTISGAELGYITLPGAEYPRIIRALLGGIDDAKLDAVAKAIFLEVLTKTAWEDASPGGQNIYRNMARAAINTLLGSLGL